MTNAFKLIEKEENTEIGGVCHLYHHTSGAKVVYIKTKDTNKVFSVAFKTPPHNDTGAAHVVEHCVLAGSKKYPLKEPFTELEKGSIYTYLNAITYQNFTIYPIASCNKEDYFNLMDVYFDAVFNPLIGREETFLREGVHFTFDEDFGHFVPGGIVYNEMQGAYADAETIRFDLAKKALFEYSSYRFDSGGKPKNILSLTYQDFLNFYNCYYTSDNCFVYFYGDMEIESCLQKADEYLSKARQNEYKKSMQESKQVRFVDEYYPVNDEEETSFSAVYVLPQNSSPLEEMAFSVLCNVLTESEASPLKKMLLDKEICYTVESSVQSDYFDEPNVLSIDMNGIKTDALSAKAIIDKCLDKIANAGNGIDKELIDSVLRRMEFFIREEDYIYKPRGLLYNLTIISEWILDKKMFQKLWRLKILSKVRELTIKGQYLEQLINTHLLKTNHAAFVALTGQAHINKQDYYHFNADKKEEVIRKKRQLDIFNSTPDKPEDIVKIPHILRSDISRKITFDAIQAQGKLLFCSIDTNGIIYTDFIFDASFIPPEKRKLVGILGILLNKCDTKKRSYPKLANAINMLTGGFDWSLESYSLANKNSISAIVLRTKCFLENFNDVFSLAEEIIHETVFSIDRIKTLIAEERSEMTDNIANDATSYSLGRASSAFYEDAFLEETEGISFYQYIKNLQDSDFESIAFELKEICDTLFSHMNCQIAVGGSESCISTIEKLTSRFIQPNTININGDLQNKQHSAMKKEAFIISSDVQYNALVTDLSQAGFVYDGCIDIVKIIINTALLTEKIRLSGGAYDCGFLVKRNGKASFYSGYDPQIKNTYDVFYSVAHFLSEYKANEAEIDKAVIGAINMLDRPISASKRLQRAVTQYFDGVTYSVIQSERDNILYASAKTINRYADIFADFNNASICTLGSKSAIYNNKEIFDKIENI